MSQLDTSGSSWIRRMTYTPVAREYKGLPVAVAQDGTIVLASGGFLILHTDHGKMAHMVPSWVPGLMAAAKSKGRAYGKLVRSKFPAVRID